MKKKWEEIKDKIDEFVTSVDEIDLKRIKFHA